MKKLIVVVSFLSMAFIANSQNLTVEGTAPNLYITHIVAPKENFYSVGRLYNQAPKTIASFNNLVMEKGLVIGQHIRIPLNAQNLDESANAGEASIPLTRVVAKGETLSKLGSELHVSADAIKQWNNLSSDNIAPGTPVVVGHLKMQAGANVAKVNSPAAPVAKQEEPKPQSQPVAEPKKEEARVATTQESTKQTEVAAKETPKQEPAKEPVKEAAPVKETNTASNENRKSDAYFASNNFGSVEGVFASVYPTDGAQKSLNTKSGEAATFKSISGWQDKKYYILMNDVQPGTIVKISSADNKVVYAKVLGSMPEMKENNGLLLRISNAAASYLGIIDPKFPVQVSYYQ
jgi:LysM repeat protein